MTSTGQNFDIYAGDSAAPVITVTDDSGAVVNLAAVDDIVFDVQRDLASGAVLRKTMSASGGISFVTDGTDGKYQIDITKADSAALTGYYMYRSWIVIEPDASPQTVTTGRLRFQRAPASTYSGDPATSDKDAVRYWLNDTDGSAFQLTDPEIAFTLTLYPNPIRAAAQCCRSLAAKYARKVSKRVGDLSISSSDISKNYLAQADELDAMAALGVTPYAGGISVSDTAAVLADSDRRKPPFRERQFDNPLAQQSDDGLMPSDERDALEQ